MKKSHVDIEMYFSKDEEKAQVCPYMLFEDNNPCVVFSMVLFKECLKEFETGDDKLGKVNIFPTFNRSSQRKTENVKTSNLKPVEDHKLEYAGIKTYHILWLIRINFRTNLVSNKNA